MNNDLDLPADRPMRDDLQEHLWERIRPQVEATLSGRRRRSVAMPLSAAAAAGVLVAGGVLMFGQVGTPGRTAPAADPADVQLAQDCVNTTIADGVDVPDPKSWQPGVKIDVDVVNGWSEFLVIRTDRAAAVCLVSGRTTGGITGPDVSAMEGRGRHSYANLTVARPFDYFDAWNFPNGKSIQFGIATDDVVAVSVVRQDNTVTPAVLRNGTFAVQIDSGELCGRPVYPDTPPAASNLLRVTLKEGQVVDGPLCRPTR